MVSKKLYNIVKDNFFLKEAISEIKSGCYGFELRECSNEDYQLWVGDPAFNPKHFLITKHQAGLIKEYYKK